MTSTRLSAHGLEIHSSIPLPELFCAEIGAIGGPVIVASGEVKIPESSSSSERMFFSPKSASDIVIGWKPVGSIRIENGDRLTCKPSDEGFGIRFRLFLLCQAMGVLLRQRGLLVLHASAVEIDGRAVAFIGVTGRGKSTLAAIAYGAGAKLISDDVLAVSFDREEVPVAIPAFPHMRLFENSLHPLGLAGNGIHMPIPHTGKVLFNAVSRFANLPQKLHRVYALIDDSETRIAPLTPLQSLLHLCEHTYGRELLPHLHKSALHLAQCSILSNGGFVRALHRPRSIDALALALECVRADLRTIPP